MKLINIVLSLSLTLGLTACDLKPEFAKLCDDHPEVCQEFKEDSWCKKERVTVGLSHFPSNSKGADVDKYNQLIAYEEYAKCMDFASQIEHIKLKNKRTVRIENAMLARQRIAEISAQTKNSEHPYLLYFHWSRYIDEQALQKLLQLEGSAAVQTSRAQFYLATHYIKRDLDKTLTLLFHALELHISGEKIENEIFKSISSIFAQKENAKLTYVWLKMAQLNEPTDRGIREDVLQTYIDGYGLNAELLDRVAASTLNKIYLGQFSEPKH